MNFIHAKEAGSLRNEVIFKRCKNILEEVEKLIIEACKEGKNTVEYETQSKDYREIEKFLTFKGYKVDLSYGSKNRVSTIFFSIYW